MFPIKDNVPTRSFPVVTVSLIAANVLVYLWEVSKPGLNQHVEAWGYYPCAVEGPCTTAAAQHHHELVETVFSSMFMHGGLLHIGGNMLFLWIFGDNVEDRMGHGRFIVFYLLCGITAALAQTAMAPDSPVPMVGASGAIAGVMGAYFVLYPRSRIVTLVPLFIFVQIMEVPAILFLGIWFFMQFISGVGSIATVAARNSGGVAFWAHVAGFVAGVAGVMVFRRPERQQVEWWDRRQP